MTTAPTQEFVEKAERLYSEKLKDELERSHLNEYVVIEPESGEHFLGHSPSEATQKARLAYPDRLGFIIRVGHRAVYHMGAVS